MVRDGTVTPIKLLHQIAGLDAYRLDIEDKNRGLRFIRVPINDEVFVEMKEETRNFNRYDPDTQQEVTGTTSEPTFLVHIKGDAQNLPTSNEVKQKYAMNAYDYSAEPGTYHITAFDRMFNRYYEEGELAEVFERLVSAIKQVKKPLNGDAKSYVHQILDIAVNKSHSEVKAYTERAAALREGKAAS